MLRPRWAFASFLALAFFAFWPALSNDFFADDFFLFVHNKQMSEPGGFWRIWIPSQIVDCWPLSMTGFWAQWQIWGEDPFWFHFVNLLLHATGVYLVYRILSKLEVQGAWFGAAIFCVHPLQAESVAWISELKNLQSGIFFFLAILAFLRFEFEGKRSGYWLSLVCFALALLSKGSTSVLPVVLLAVLWWKRRPLGRARIAQFVPFFVMAAIMGWITAWHQRVAGAGDPDWALAPADRLQLVGRLPWFYLWKFLWPANLSYFLGSWDLQVWRWLGWLGLFGIFAGLGALWIKRRNELARNSFVGVSLYLILLLPVLGLVDIYFFRFSFAASRYQYLASIALAAFAGVAICYARFRWPKIGSLAAVAIILALSAMSMHISTYYYDTLRADERELEIHPNSVPGRLGLAEMTIGLGFSEEAESHARLALTLQERDMPGDQRLHRYILRLLADSLERQGKKEEAERLRPR